MSETDLVKSLADYLTWHGFLIIRVNSGAIKSDYTDRRGRLRQRLHWFVRWFTLGRDPQTAGVADLLAFRAGLYLAVEAKLPGNQPTAAQREFLVAWTEHGGVGVVAHSVDELAAALYRVGVG